jgi:hypothetical protein
MTDDKPFFHDRIESVIREAVASTPATETEQEAATRIAQTVDERYPDIAEECYVAFHGRELFALALANELRERWTWPGAKEKKG